MGEQLVEIKVLQGLLLLLVLSYTEVRHNRDWYSLCLQLISAFMVCC
jgi:hypothetical protein